MKWEEEEMKNEIEVSGSLVKKKSFSKKDVRKRGLRLGANFS